MQAILLHAMTAMYAVTGGHLTALRAWHAAVAGAPVPDPIPQAPPGLAAKTDIVLGWGKWGVLVCGVAGLLISGGKMAIGHRNRSALAADGATGIPWVIGGLSLVAASAGIVAVFL
jgi:hypothetical protein